MFETAAVVASITIPASALIITVIKTKSNKENSNGKDSDSSRGLCPAHNDLVTGLTAFRREVMQQFQDLNKIIMELAVKKGHE
jgi:hypothetical protein